MFVNRHALFFFGIWVFNLILTIVYTINLELDPVYNLDAVHYRDGYLYLKNNPFDISGVRDYFGRPPEFLLQYYYSVISQILSLESVKSVMLLNAITGYLLIWKAFTKISSNNKYDSWVIRILLCSMIPVGVFVQTARQAIALFLFLYVFLLLKKHVNFRYLFGVVVILSTHVGSVFIVPLMRVVHSKKYVLMSVFLYVVSTYLVFAYLVGPVFGRPLDLVQFELSVIFTDIYLLIAIVISLSLMVVSKNNKSFYFMLALLLFFYNQLVVQISLMSRILYAFSWFWIVYLMLVQPGKFYIKKSQVVYSIAVSLNMGKLFWVI